MLAVLIFMLVYYRWAGVNADIALILNLVILLGFMGYFGAVLTLPGESGMPGLTAVSRPPWQRWLPSS